MATTNNSEELWNLEQVEDHWRVMWPRTHWIPIKDTKSLETLIDVSFQCDPDNYTEISFYMETIQGRFTHWISPELWMTQGMTERLASYWASLEARVWGVGFPKQGMAENFMQELSKRYTLYLLKQQY
jgi:hypothetical protein